MSLGPGDSFSWAPDSQHVVVLVEGSSVIFDATGLEIFRYAGADDAVWLDKDTLLLRDRDDVPITGAPTASGPSPIYQVRLGSAAMNLIGYDGGFAVSNGQGLAAVASSASDSFRVWDEQSWSSSAEGYPVEWSLRDDRLTILHQTDTGMGTEGTAEVLVWPALTSIASDPSHITAAESVHIDPSGNHLAYMSYGQLYILDLTSGESTTLGGGSTSSWFGWDADGHLVAADSDSKMAYSYALDGTKTMEWGHVGDSVVTSRDGSTILFYSNDFANRQPPMTLVQGEQVRQIAAGGLSGRPPDLAPDGHALIVSAYAGNQELILVSE